VVGDGWSGDRSFESASRIAVSAVFPTVEGEDQDREGGAAGFPSTVFPRGFLTGRFSSVFLAFGARIPFLDARAGGERQARDKKDDGEEPVEEHSGDISMTGVVERRARGEGGRHAGPKGTIEADVGVPPGLVFSFVGVGVGELRWVGKRGEEAKEEGEEEEEEGRGGPVCFGVVVGDERSDAAAASAASTIPWPAPSNGLVLAVALVLVPFVRCGDGGR